MNTKKYQWIFYLITTTIVTTIGVQFYWNYKNYEENKQRVSNEIQLSLDNAVEEYYSSLAKNNFLTIIDSKYSIDNKETSKNLSSIKKPRVTINNLKITTDENLSKEKIDSLMNSSKKFITKITTNFDSIERKKTDSIKIMTQFTDFENGYTLHKNGTKSAIKYFKGKKAADSLKLFTNLKPIFISFLDQSVAYEKIDSLIENQLNKKGINLSTSFHHLKNDTLFHQTKDTLLDATTFSVNSKSTFVREGEAFQLIYLPLLWIEHIQTYTKYHDIV